uniref:Uncharacterized protein n=1 Tax=Fusarium oxysporum (strain Fo5176) TaxID=660025 RepID=A0A0D2YBI6_FUSOF
MELERCGCSLGRYFTIFDNSHSISTLVDIHRNLRQRRRQRHAIGYETSLNQYRFTFTTRLGIPGKDLYKWEERAHQEGLIEMSHEFLCVKKNGSSYWSSQFLAKNDRDQYEIYKNIIWFFVRRNAIDHGKKIRSKRPLDRLDTPCNGSDTPSPPYHATPSDSTTTEEGIDSPPSSQSSESSQGSAPESAQNNTLPISYSRTYSPDELAGEVSAQPRRESRMQDARDNLRHTRLYRQSNIGINHTERGDIPSVPLVSTGTQTGLETDEYRERDANAPPPSSMNTNNASQQSDQNTNEEYEHRQARESLEYGQKSPSPAFQIPRSTSPEPKPNINLIFSYDALPGLNIRLSYGEEIFSFSREQLFRELCWQHEFEWLLICLQSPGVLYPEYIPKADGREFRKVMARFEQIVDAMKRDYAEVERDTVIEIAFVPVCKGHSRTVMIEAWLKRMTESRG